MDPKSLPEPKSKVALPKATPPADPLGLRLHPCPHWFNIPTVNLIGGASLESSQEQMGREFKASLSYKVKSGLKPRESDRTGLQNSYLTYTKL